MSSEPEHLPAPRRPEGAPAAADHERKFAAFLDQGRWLLEEQQRRGASFQTTAGTMLGFDGVVLGILASNNFLATEDGWSIRSVVGKVGVLALGASAYAAVRVIAPRAVGSVVIDDTLDAWTDFHDDRKFEGVRPTQTFAHMLLAKDPAPTASPPSQRRWWDRGASGSGPQQVLHQAAQLAEYRSRWTRRSAWCLLAAVIALVLAVFIAPGTTPSDTNPAPSSSATHQ